MGLNWKAGLFMFGRGVFKTSCIDLKNYDGVPVGCGTMVVEEFSETLGQLESRRGELVIGPIVAVCDLPFGRFDVSSVSCDLLFLFDAEDLPRSVSALLDPVLETNFGVGGGLCR